MKKLLLLTAFVLLLSFGVQAADFIGQAEAGWALQKGYSGTLMYGVSPGIELKEVKDNYKIFAQTTLFYSDRPFQGLGEIEAKSFMVFYRKELTGSIFYLGLAGGTWNVTNPYGENISPPAGRFEIGADFLGIDVNAGGTVLQLPGNDMYFLSLNINLIGNGE